MKRRFTALSMLCTGILLVLAVRVPASRRGGFEIESVRFEGNEAFGHRRLLGVMVSRPSVFLNPSYYREELFSDDLENLKLFYRQNGYLEADIAHHEVRRDTLDRKVHILVGFAEGELTLVEGITLFGNRFFPKESLHGRIAIEEGAPLSSRKIERSTLSLLTLYADNGFLDAGVTPEIKLNRDTHRAIVDFIAKEGEQFSIAKVEIEGLGKTRPGVVSRELLFREGDIVRYSRLLETQRRLYLTGLFQSVFVRPVGSSDPGSGFRDILIELRESESGEFNISLGYGTIEKMRGRIEVFDTNLRGTARKAGVSTWASFVGRGVELSFTEPWTLGTRWRTDIVLAAGYEKEPGFELTSVGGRISAGRSFETHSTVTVTYRHEKVDLRETVVEEIPEDTKSSVRSLALTLAHDRRDNIFNSTEGVYLEVQNELGSAFIRELNGFLRFQANLRYFHRRNPSTVIATSAAAGWMYSRAGLSGVPLNERFYAGGPNTLRGFDYRRVGPLDANRLPTGGRLKLLWNVFEVRRVLYRMVGGVLFFDVGNVWSSPGEVRIRDLRMSPGLGLRVNTPLGFVRLDYGFNPYRREGEPPGMLYFSMGQTF